MKKIFPIYQKHSKLAYLDSAATALKPKSVIDAVCDYYSFYSANIHRGIYEISEEATKKYEEARDVVAKFIGAKSNEIVFTRGTTESINLVACGWGEINIKQGDEIILTVMEHHSNLLPWQILAKKTGAKLKYLGLKNGQLDLTELKNILTSKTKLVALTQISNVLGMENPIKELATQVKNYNSDIKILVDGAQAVAHIKVDVKDLGVDFYAFSGHKLYGPTGIGVLWARSEILDKMEPLNYGGGMIKEVSLYDSILADGVDKFEGGTPPIAEVIALAEAVKFVENLGFDFISDREEKLMSYLIEQISNIPNLKIVGQGSSLMTFVIEGVHTHDVAEILNRYGVCVRSGHHCAMPLHEILGVEATTRVSLGIYNDKDDIDNLIKGLKEVGKIFKVKLPI
ncbi:MAG: SufS family cysteine desulfurase [Candidatus Shapirobacteria bacterium]|nr:SufS family cysteine desulfurase [Candidatus Shapirobacteria bacterium]